MQYNNQKIARNTIALYIRTAVTMVVSFLSVRVTLQVLGSEDYGLNNLVGSVVSLLSFISASMGTSVQRFLSVEIGKDNISYLRKIFGVGLYLHCCIAIITFIACELFAAFFFYKLNIPDERLFSAQLVFQISSLSLLISIITVPFGSLLRAHEEFAKFALLDIFQAFGRLIVLYALFVIDFDKLILLSILNFIISLMYIGGTVVLSRKYPEGRFHIEKDKKMIKEMLGFISLLLFTVLFSVFRDNGIVIFINMFFGLLVNAAYAIALQMMTVVNTFAMNFKQALVPQMMAAYGANDMKRMNELIFTGTKITSILLLIITLPIIFETHYVLDIVLKDVPNMASEFTRLTMINVNIASFTYFLYQGVHATGKIKGQQVAMSSLYALNVLFVYLLYLLGCSCYSALYVTIGCSLIQCLINVFFSNKTFGFNAIKYLLLASKFLVVVIFVSVFSNFVDFMEESLIRFVFRTLIILMTIFIGSIAYLDSRERMYCKDLLHGMVNKCFKVLSAN